MNSYKVNENLTIHPSQVFIASCSGWLSGVFLISFFEKLDLSLIIILILVFLFSWLLLKNKWLIFLIILLIGLILGILRYQNYLTRDSSKIIQYNGTRQDFLGVIAQEPDIRINHQKLTIKITEIGGYKLTNQKNLVLLNVGLYPKYQYGDELLINCNLKAPQPFDDFSYDRFLAKKGIYSVCSFAKVKIISHGNADWLKEKIIAIKKIAQQKINQNLPEPQASIASALVLGNRKTLPPDLIEAFSKTGTSHMIAISGMHIAIICGLIGYSLIFVGVRRQYLILFISPILAIYISLIGFTASAVRSSIMGFVLLIAISLGRLSRGINILLLTAVLITAYNPLLIRDDIGFQLSFAAVFGIMQFSEFFIKIGKLIIPFDFVNKIFATSCAATLATAPLTIWHFGRFSVIGLLANILIIPVLPLAMILILGAVLATLIFSTTSGLIFWPAYFILVYIVKVVFWFSYIPYGFIDF